LEEYVTEKGNPGNYRQVDIAEVLLPSKVLKLGFHFIDTPGVGSSITANTATTLRFLSEADAAVFVTSFEATMNESELSLLRTLAQQVRKIFFVVNKLDLVSSDESESVLASIRKIISAELGDADPQIFAVSARQGLEAKLSGSLELLKQSGLSTFEEALTCFLTSERIIVVLSQCIERTMALLTPKLIADRSNQGRANLQNELLRTIEHKWKDRLDHIEATSRDIIENLRQRIKSELPTHFECEINSHCAVIRDRLAAQADAVLTRHRKFFADQDPEELKNLAQKVAHEERNKWLSAHQGEFDVTQWKLAAESVEQLEDLYCKALEFACRLYGLPMPSARWTIGREDIRFSWRAYTPFEWDPRFAWELDVFSVGWLRRRAQREHHRTLTAAVAAYQEHLVQALSEAGSEWVDHLNSELQEALKSLSSFIPVNSENSPVWDIYNNVRQLLGRLKAMREKLADKDLQETSISTQLPVGEYRGTRRCYVCERIGLELFDFFSRRQHELSANKGKQQIHMENGGFCRFHTWQYERIASPQGVCDVYAPFLADIARRMRDIASSASSTDSMLDCIRKLRSSPDKCPACKLITAVEVEAIEEFRQMLLSGGNRYNDICLCVEHLIIALEQQTDLEIIRTLVFEEANILEHISQDMKTYLLKRDAFKRDLLRDEELSAYLVGLSFLVGDKSFYIK